MRSSCAPIRDVRISIEGHCDERGSTEYNLGLGQRRAEAAKNYLISLGISADRMETVSWGKERPFCTDHNEECWQQNRRGSLRDGSLGSRTDSDRERRTGTPGQVRLFANFSFKRAAVACDGRVYSKEGFLCAHDGSCSRLAAMFFGALGGAIFSPQPAGAVSREIVELQQQVSQLLQGQQDLRSAVDTNSATLKTLVQQSLDSVNKLNRQMDACRKWCRKCRQTTARASTP